MTDPVLDPAPQDTLLAHEVADYLRRHPDFLSQYPDLANALELPREQGQVASLASYQTQQLREKNAELERRLAELVANAKENESLMQRVHDLNVAVLRARTPAVAARSVVAKLGEDFHTDHVRLIVYGQSTLPPADWLVHEPGGRAAIPEFADYFAHHEPIAGRLSHDRLQRLFGTQADEIRSAAVMPLGEFGLLAIGSKQADHFQPGMGTVFLKMIAAAVTAALAHSQDAV